MPEALPVAVIGGGPAGLMAAEILAQAGCRVTVYDRMPSLGRKLLMAGRGGLNLTHSEALAAFITRYGAAAARLEPALRAFSPQDLRRWCAELGQDTFIGSSGRVFPCALKASPLLRALLRRLEGQKVRFALGHGWQGWAADSALRFQTPQGEIIERPAATLLALGGASWPRLGADGGWASWLAAAGVALAPLRPANCGFIAPWSDHFAGRHAGQPLKPVALTHGSRTLQGEAMITAQGLEGGVIYALSAALREDIATTGVAAVMLDLRPDMNMAQLTQKLAAPRGGQSLSNHLRKTARFAPAAIGLLREITPAATLAQAGPAQLAALLKNLPLRFTACAPLARAISTAGGISFDALDDHYMLHALPGTFAAGEMLDWEAPTGGYLLQACFSTGRAAAYGLLRWTGLNPA